MTTFTNNQSPNRSFNSGTSSLVLSKDGEALMGRASDPMTSIKARQNNQDGAQNNDPYRFLDDSEGEGSCTEKLSASDLMMEPGTISKQKLDTVDLRLLNSEESQKNTEGQLTSGLLPTATTGQAETYQGSDEKEMGAGFMSNIESAESRINQLRE